MQSPVACSAARRRNVGLSACCRGWNRLSAPLQPHVRQPPVITRLACTHPHLASHTARTRVFTMAGKEGTIFPRPEKIPSVPNQLRSGGVQNKVGVAGDGLAALGAQQDRSVRTYNMMQET